MQVSAREHRAQRRDVLRSVVNVVIFPNRSYLSRYQGRTGVVRGTLLQVEDNLSRLRCLDASMVRSILIVDILNIRTVLPKLVRFRNAYLRTFYRRRVELVLPTYSAEQIASATSDCAICYEKMVVAAKPFPCSHVICEGCALRSAHFQLNCCAFCRAS